MKTEQLVQSFLGHGLNSLSSLNRRLTGQIGFRLFCTPFSPKIKPIQEKFLQLGKSNLLNLDGIPIQTYQWGNGPHKVLFLHGWRSNSFRWKPYIDKIDFERYTIHALDAPAHGLSGGKILNAPLYGQAIHRFFCKHDIQSIVAHSIGAFATAYALCHFENIKISRLIILGSPSNANDFVNRFQQTLQLKDGVIDAIEQHFLKLYHHPPSYFDTGFFLKDLPIPGLIIHDQGDDLAPIIDAHKNHKAWKKSELIVTEGLGHRLKDSSVIRHVLSYLDRNI